MKDRARRVDESALRFYAALSRTNGAIIRIREPQALFDEICAICVDHGHARMAYIAMADGAGHARAVASAGPADAFLAGIDISLDPASPNGNGPIARTIREGRPHVANDLHSDPTTLAWRDRALRLGSRATAAFPIRRAGRVVGALSLHVGHKHFFDDALVRLLCEIVADLSFALDTIDGEAARLVAMREMEVGFARFQKIFHASPVATAIWSLGDGRLQDANDACCGLLGYSREELFADACRVELKRCHAELDLDGQIERLRAQHRVREHETQLHVRSGHVRDVLVSAELIDFLEQRCVLTIISDITERKAYESSLRHFATHDGLTGLPNRHLFYDRTAQALGQSRRTQTLAAILLIDIDRMTIVNDELGHQIGDMVLQLVGERLRAVMGDGDSVARLGGDKFVVSLAGLRLESDARIKADQVGASFGLSFWVLGHELHLTASVGASLYPRDGPDVDTLIRHADIAMHHAKRMGSGGCQFFTPEMTDGLHPKLDLQAHLRRALDAHQLYLEYQPKVRLSDGVIDGAEALLRWRHPDLGIVSPATFIPLAEENGMIGPIGDWVLREACAQNATWQKNGLPPITMAVNVSARQLLQPQIGARVISALREAGLSAEWLELEITESVIAQDVEKVGAFIGELKALGVRFAIDDFGTGYSSLSYLKRFRVDRLKIDQSFVRQLPADLGDAAIVRAIISLAQSVGVSVTAEGVETAAQCRFLHTHGCDELQGYFFSRPVSAERFAEMLRSRASLPVLSARETVRRARAAN